MKKIFNENKKIDITSKIKKYKDFKKVKKILFSSEKSAFFIFKSTNPQSNRMVYYEWENYELI